MSHESGKGIVCDVTHNTQKNRKKNKETNNQKQNNIRQKCSDTLTCAAARETTVKRHLITQKRP